MDFVPYTYIRIWYVWIRTNIKREKVTESGSRLLCHKWLRAQTREFQVDCLKHHWTHLTDGLIKASSCNIHVSQYSIINFSLPLPIAGGGWFADEALLNMCSHALTCDTFLSAASQTLCLPIVQPECSTTDCHIMSSPQSIFIFCMMKDNKSHFESSAIILFLLTWPAWLVSVPWTCLLTFLTLKRVTTPSNLSPLQWNSYTSMQRRVYYCISNSNIHRSIPTLPFLCMSCIQPTSWWGCFFNPCWSWEYLENIHYYQAWLDGFLVVEFVEWEFFANLIIF